MSKRGWIIAVILAGLMVVGIGGGVILAHGGKGGDRDGKTNAEGQSLAARVAEILEVEESDVSDAFATVKDNWDSDTDFIAEVSIILEVEQSDLENAFAQAKREMANKAVRARADAMVEKELLTQDEADEYVEWFESRPEFVNRGFGGSRFGGWGRGGKGGGYSRMKDGRGGADGETVWRSKFRR